MYGDDISIDASSAMNVSILLSIIFTVINGTSIPVKPCSRSTLGVHGGISTPIITTRNRHASIMAVLLSPPFAAAYTIAPKSAIAQVAPKITNRSQVGALTNT